MGSIYQQTAIDTCSKVAFAKLYDTKTLITAADLLNDRVLTDRGIEYCGNPESDELEADLDAWIRDYNVAHILQGSWCYGKTPMQTFVDNLPVAKDKLHIAA